jgi:ssDNA-binding replication factor A large subunit
VKISVYEGSIPTFFNQETMITMLEIDKVYYISNCQIKAANKQFSKLRNDYEMTLSQETQIQECTDVTQIPQIKYNFTQITDIGAMEVGAIVPQKLEQISLNLRLVRRCWTKHRAQANVD